MKRCWHWKNFCLPFCPNRYCKQPLLAGEKPQVGSDHWHILTRQTLFELVYFPYISSLVCMASLQCRRLVREGKLAL